MACTIQIYEDSGAVLSGKGTTRELVTNCNWKATASMTPYNYYLFPLRRPVNPEIEYESYTKYLFFKVSGTYTTLKNFKIHLSAVPGLASKLYYKMGSVYQAPSNVYDPGLMYLDSAKTLFPNLSTVGPEGAVSRPLKMENNTTFYTGYLVTQLRVHQSDYFNVGNTNPVEIKLTFDEFED